MKAGYECVLIKRGRGKVGWKNVPVSPYHVWLDKLWDYIRYGLETEYRSASKFSFWRNIVLWFVMFLPRYQINSHPPKICASIGVNFENSLVILKIQCFIGKKCLVVDMCWLLKFADFFKWCFIMRFIIFKRFATLILISK